jgi:phasin family protein
MALTPEHLSGWQKAAIDSTIACTQAALAGAEDLLRLNLQAARTALEQHAQVARALLGTTDPQALMQVRSRLAQQAMQETAAYAQEAHEILAATVAQLSQHAERQRAVFGDASAAATEPAPAGANVTVAAVKSSLAASAAMIDSLDRATRQFADLSNAAISAAVSEGIRPERGARP